MSTIKSLVLAVSMVALIAGCGIEGQLATQAKKLNKKCPMVIDEFTTLESVAAGPGKKFTYIYTVSMQLNQLQKTTITDQVRSRALAEPKMQPILDKGVELVYRYNDKSGNKVLEFSVKK